MLIFLLVITGLSAITFGAYYFWRKSILSDLREGAAVDYETLRKKDPELIGELTLEEFTEIHVQTEEPRFPGYVTAIVITFLMGSPLFLMILLALIYFGNAFGLIPQPQSIATELYLGADGTSPLRKVSPETLGYMVRDYSGFYYFFGLLGFWICTVYLFLRRYHQRSRPTVREAILLSR